MKAVVMFCLWLGACMAAQACKPVADNRPFYERLRTAPLVFIGKVVSVEGRKAIFEVEHALIPASNEKRIVVDLPQPSTCAIAFEAGQRWLFGGTFGFNPSVRLDIGPAGQRLDADAVGRLRREDDKRLALTPQLTSCESDGQCSFLGYDCSQTAVNRERLKDANAHVFGGKRAGHPTTVSCVAPDQSKGGGIPWPLCHAKKCGSWGVVFN